MRTEIGGLLAFFWRRSSSLSVSSTCSRLAFGALRDTAARVGRSGVVMTAVRFSIWRSPDRSG